MTYGCHDHGERVTHVDVQIGWIEGRREMRTIPTTWDRGCRYDLNTTDRGCTGCKWIGEPQPSTTPTGAPT